MLPLASIIVPIYKVEEHFARGLEQLLAQTYEALEILLIDDGSPDNCPQLCDDAARNYQQVRTFHQANAGAGAARNLGIEQAKGDYIFFYDIDDEINPTLVETCVREMEARQVDLLCFGFDVVEQSTQHRETIVYQEAELHGENALRSVYLETFALSRHGNGFLWNKVYRRSFLMRNNLRIGNERIQQDEVFNLNVYPLVTSAYIMPRSLYTYYIYESGNIRSRFLPHRFEYYVTVRKAFEQLQKTWQISDPRFGHLLRQRFRTGIDQALRYNLFHPDCPWSKTERMAYLQTILSHPYTKDALSVPSNGWEQRLFTWVYQRQSLLLLRFCHQVINTLRKHYRRLR